MIGSGSKHSKSSHEPIRPVELLFIIFVDAWINYSTAESKAVYSPGESAPKKAKAT